MLIKEWYVHQSAQIKAKFDTTMKFLNERPRHEWGKPAQKPRFRVLTNDLQDFCEIRFFADNVQRRPIGFFSGDKEFTILEFAIEKGDKLHPKPKVLLKILNQRMELVQRDKGRYTHVWQID